MPALLLTWASACPGLPPPAGVRRHFPTSDGLGTAWAVACGLTDEDRLAADDPVPVVVVRLPAARAHSLAHLLADWAAAFRLVPDRGDKPSTYLSMCGAWAGTSW